MFHYFERVCILLSLACALVGFPALGDVARAQTSTGFVKGGSCDPENALDIADSYERAMLDMIAYTEGTRGHGKDGYNVTYAYHYFERCDEHPNLKVCAGKYCSTAAGRYQFLYKTYQGLDMPGFWPEDQERAALELIARRGVTLPEAAPLTATQFANALDKLSYEWASLPPGRYGQPMHSLDQIRAEYCRLAGCNLKYPPPPVPTPSVDADSVFLALQDDGTLYRYSNQGDGRFTPEPLGLAWEQLTAMGAGADYNEDGIADFMALDPDNGLLLYTGDDAGRFSERPLPIETRPLATVGASGDYDHDGHADFIAVDATGALSVGFGVGEGSFDFVPLPNAPADVRALGGGGDYTGDGQPDFIALLEDGSTELYVGDGEGDFDERSLQLDGSRLRALGAADDYTGDGFADFLALAEGGAGYLYVGLGDGRFEARQLSEEWQGLRFID